MFRPSSISFRAEIKAYDQSFPNFRVQLATVVRIISTEPVYIQLNEEAVIPSGIFPDVLSAMYLAPNQEIYLSTFEGDLLHWIGPKKGGFLHLTRMV